MEIRKPITILVFDMMRMLFDWADFSNIYFVFVPTKMGENLSKHFLKSF